MFVGYEETIRMSGLGKDCTADERLLSMAFYVFLDGYDVVAQLLDRQVVQIPRVN